MGLEAMILFEIIRYYETKINDTGKNQDESEETFSFFRFAKFHIKAFEFLSTGVM